MKKTLLSCLLLLIATSLFSMAQSDIQLQEVDALIEERRINEALALVEQYIRQNPDDFDNAQKRIDIIFKARNDYKEKADELVRIIVEDPLNDRLKLEIIEDLESMEANPNEEERKFIANIKTTSQFTYFRALYEQIIADGTALLNEKDYVASAQRFTDGFELYFDEFFELDIETSLVQDVISRLNAATESVDNYAQIQSSLNTSFAQFNQVVSQNNLTASLNQFDNLSDVLNEFAQIRNTSIQSGFYFEDQTNILQEQNPELTDAFFLPFAYRILLGRGNDAEANIVKAMDTQWNDLYETSRNNVSAMIAYYTDDLNQSLIDQTVNQINTNSNTIRSKLDTLQSVIDMGENFLAQYELLNESPTTFESNPYVEYANLLDYTSYLVAQTSSLIEGGTLLLEARDTLANYPLPTSPSEDILNRNTNYSQFHVNSLQSTESYAQSALADTTDIRQVEFQISSDTVNFGSNEYTVYQPALELTQILTGHFDALVTQNHQESLLAWEALSENLETGSNTIQRSYEVPYVQAIPEINEALDITVQSNPASALQTLESLMQTIEQDIAALQQEYDFLNTPPENQDIGIQDSVIYLTSRDNILEDITYLQEISSTSENYITLANQRVRLSQQAENEGDLRFRQAQEYLDQENFAASRDALQRARTKYNEALSYQYSDTLREDSDEQLASLGEEISFIENEIIVRNVRTLITQSRQNYYNSNFSQAEAIILQAEAQWSITNIQENPEIVALKALIGNALSITTGRTIPPTDPLYPEMSQTLNVAYQHYDNAENLLDRNNRDQALAELELARNKIRDVQVLYPFHQEASLLALQIDELIDPVAFQEQFSQKFEQAQVDYRDSDTSARAYIDLLDLYEINPDYPGLEDFIYVVELELGIILPPPNLQALARSETLTQQAEGIYDSGARDEITLNNALALLNEAIDLNADNQDALILLDRINTTLGGATVIVLSSEAENLYQQAVQELSNGNTITAAALVSQLMQLPGVQNSSKIIDLQQRVESLL